MIPMNRKDPLINLMLFGILTIVLISTSPTGYKLVSGESQVTMWNKTYGGAQTEEAKSVIQTTAGGYAIAGYIYSFAEGY
jgi:hypothetical protein